MRHINVGVIGFGTVGSGVVEALIKKRSHLSRRIGSAINIVKICDKDLGRKRCISIDKSLLTRDADDILNDPRVDIVIELIGGIHPAYEIICRALKSKKHVVTANKALLALKKEALLKLAFDNNVQLKFEASVAGGVPIIKALKEGLVSNKVNSIYGIINGTCNYILSGMTNFGIGFDEALANAQKKGYAEKSPVMDISGLDSAHKLAILASLGFGLNVRLSDMLIEGISSITDADIKYAAEWGYVIKLLGIAKATSGGLEARVHPTLVPNKHPLASVGKNFNAIFINTDMLGDSLFYGKGAGSVPTASAVLSDIADISKDIICASSCRGCGIVYDNYVSRVKKKDDFSSSYYVRFSAIDKPGVLARISRIFSEYKISIAFVSQEARRQERIVPIVMMTHIAKERDFAKALAEIDSLTFIKKKSVVIRAEESLNEK
ncbi:MAG: homoserine dehydrogenase [Candidatus Omnitrophica bacterium]|nr:homoserine dehydrogenase [Candidatus Omnitrophota bacterium]